MSKQATETTNSQVDRQQRNESELDGIKPKKEREKERNMERNETKKNERKLFVTQLLLAPKSYKLFRKICSPQVRLPTFCLAYQRYIAIFVNDHVGAGWKVQNIWRY